MLTAVKLSTLKPRATIFRVADAAGLCIEVRADGGRSWTPVEMAMHYTGPLIIVGGMQRIVENGQPRYLLPAHRNTKRNDPLGDRDQFMLSSTSLLEWRLAGHIPQPASGPVLYGIAMGISTDSSPTPLPLPRPLNSADSGVPPSLCPICSNT